MVRSWEMAFYYSLRIYKLRREDGVGIIVLEALDAFSSSQQSSSHSLPCLKPLIWPMHCQCYHLQYAFCLVLVPSQVSSSSRQPGEQVYALVYISDLQLSGWVEAVVIGEEAMPGTVSFFYGSQPWRRLTNTWTM
jgi:hypothetical protein